MGRRILMIQGHPDDRPHLCHALERAYADAATAAGHQVRHVEIATLDIPVLRDPKAWEDGTLPDSLADVQASIAWAEHLVVLFPLWLGDMPALLKAFFEQVLRPGFAFERGSRNPLTAKKLGGRSARVVVTMGMPALAYRWVFRAHSVKSLERNILGFVGIAPVHETLVGGAGAVDAARAKKLVATMARLGRDAR